jgi:hypothetical protein
MDDLLAKLLGGIALIVMLFFDWPRAVAGAVLGFVARNFGRPWIVIPIGVIAIAGLGELLYSAVGFREAVTRDGFILGLVTSGVTSMAVMFGLDGATLGGSE